MKFNIFKQQATIRLCRLFTVRQEEGGILLAFQYSHCYSIEMKTSCFCSKTYESHLTSGLCSSAHLHGNQSPTYKYCATLHAKLDIMLCKLCSIHHRFVNEHLWICLWVVERATYRTFNMHHMLHWPRIITCVMLSDIRSHGINIIQTISQ